jgi:hypothetical protein
MPNYTVVIMTEYKYFVEDVPNEWEAVKVAMNDPDSTISISDRAINISAELINEPVKN